MLEDKWVDFNDFFSRLGFKWLIEMYVSVKSLWIYTLINEFFDVELLIVKYICPVES